MGRRQFRHDSTSIGAPCGRCGLVYSPKTAYVPCFEEGDSFETWKARQPVELQPLLKPPPAGTAKPRDVFVAGDEKPRVTLDAAKQAAIWAILRVTPLGQVPVADAVVAALSALIVAHIQEAECEQPDSGDYAAIVADRDRLAARVKELEAELARSRTPPPPIHVPGPGRQE